MDCRKYRLLISREIDGEADASEIAAVYRHVASCASCESFRAISLAGAAIHRSAPEHSPSPRLVEAVCALAREERRSFRPRSWFRFAVPAAAAAVFAVGLWIGSLMHDLYDGGGAGMVADRVEGFELEYLDEFPPGSFGSVLASSSEGGAE